MDVDWQFLLDENVEPRTADVLRKSEYHADRVVDVSGEGAADRARVERRRSSSTRVG
jgi:predicted nuclease of predicted toxin-antitoxin system